MVLFLISIYFGGEVTFTSQSGADYTLNSRLTLSSNEIPLSKRLNMEYFKA
jgi:hypothetical protein